MMRLDDPIWQTLKGGYHVLYDASSALLALQSGDDRGFVLLWENLHHQGDVDEASYAALPALVEIGRARHKRDWNFYGLINTIELSRQQGNPPIPEWLDVEYHAALHELLAIALADIPNIEDPLTLRQAFASAAIAKGNIRLGRLLADLDDSEIDAILNGNVEWL